MFLRNKINFVTLKSRFGGTRSRFPRNGYIRQSGESCRVEARQGETSRGPPRLATNESTPHLASPRLVSIAKKADSSRLASPRLVDSPSRLASCSSLSVREIFGRQRSKRHLGYTSGLLCPRGCAMPSLHSNAI